MIILATMDRDTRRRTNICVIWKEKRMKLAIYASEIGKINIKQLQESIYTIKGDNSKMSYKNGETERLTSDLWILGL